MEVIKNISKIVWGRGVENSEEIPKIVWIYWEGKSSEVVNRCLEKLKCTLLDYDIKIINNNTLRNFLPNIISYKKELPLANYSDIIRLDLLRNYGGIWMDASILITEDFKWLEITKNLYKPELIGFYSDLYTTNLNKPIIETWFLAVCKNSKFINDWYNEYANCYTSNNPHTYFSELKKHPEQIQGLYNDVSADYLICYLAGINVMIKNTDYRIVMFSANQSGHLYKFGFGFTPNDFFKFFLTDKSFENAGDLPFLIKFINSTRTLLDTAIFRGLYNKSSLLYVISPDKYYYYNKFMRSFNYLYYITSNLLKKMKIFNLKG